MSNRITREQYDEYLRKLERYFVDAERACVEKFSGQGLSDDEIKVLFWLGTLDATRGLREGPTHHL